MSHTVKLSQEPSTFGLDAFTVGRDDDTLDLPEFEVLQDLSEPHHNAPLHASLHGVLLVQAVLETNQRLQQICHTLVHVFAQHLAAIADTYDDIYISNQQKCDKNSDYIL